MFIPGSLLFDLPIKIDEIEEKELEIKKKEEEKEKKNREKEFTKRMKNFSSYVNKISNRKKPITDEEKEKMNLEKIEIVKSFPMEAGSFFPETFFKLKENDKKFSVDEDVVNKVKEKGIEVISKRFQDKKDLQNYSDWNSLPKEMRVNAYMKMLNDRAERLRKENYEKNKDQLAQLMKDKQAMLDTDDNKNFLKVETFDFLEPVKKEEEKVEKKIGENAQVTEMKEDIKEEKDNVNYGDDGLEINLTD